MWQTILDKLHKTFITNWLTGIPGGLAFACESAALLDMLPADWKAKAQSVCMCLITLGLIGAKGQNVSNSPVPVKAQVVSETNEAKVNPSIGG